jgi:UTP--glucose-1-phosphate uridylyltransferase
MKIKKAVITAAGRAQRKLPLQSVIDEHGDERSVLGKIIDEAARADVSQIAVVVAPGESETYASEAAWGDAEVRFIEQPSPRGYGDAILRAREFVAGEPFLHFVGDHIYVSDSTRSCAELLTAAAVAQQCAVSAVQVTREHLLPYFGAVSGPPVPGTPGTFKVETVLEKPTPTEAEIRLQVSGLRAGQYLCFFGMHVLTPGVIELLEEENSRNLNGNVCLTAALAKLSRKEKYLALEISSSRRFDIGHKYGLFYAQMAMALRGPDREQVLTRMFEVAASSGSGGTAKGNG